MEFITLTSLRFGKLVALRLRDYHKAFNVIDINGSITNFKKGTPKNVYSVRKVMLNKRAVEILDILI